MKRLFSSIYDKVMAWAKHKHAPRYLGILSFAESSFFPIPPDVMLIPMTLAKPNSAWWFALLTTVSSVLGGILGYCLGLFMFDLIEPVLHQAGYWEVYLRAVDWFKEWGFWAIFLAGFSPIPYKIFTVSAGVIAMAIAPFIIASLIGRGARFFIVAGVVRWGGARVEPVIRRNIERLGWATLALALLLYIGIKIV